MTTTAAPHQDRSLQRARGGLAVPLAVVAASFVVGVLTSLGQRYLPAELHSVANSSTSWAVVAFALALLARRWWSAALFAVAAFVGQLSGYEIASRVLVGYGLAPATWAFWLAQATLAGPLLGVAAWWARRDPGLGRALAVALVAGIAVGEGAYGLTVVAATTSPVWWWISIGLGAAAVATYAANSRSLRLGLVAVSGTAVVAAAFWWAYQLAGSVLVG